MKRIFIISLFIITSAFSNTTTPEKVLENYFKNVKELNFKGASKHIHSHELLNFQKLLLAVFSTVPYEKEKEFFSTFSHIKDFEDAIDQTPSEFYINFLQSTHNKKNSFFSQLQQTDQEIIGTLYDKNTQTHYVTYRLYKNNKKTLSESKVITQPMMKENNNFKLMLTKDIKVMAKSLYLALSK